MKLFFIGNKSQVLTFIVDLCDECVFDIDDQRLLLLIHTTPRELAALGPEVWSLLHQVYKSETPHA